MADARASAPDVACLALTMFTTRLLTGNRDISIDLHQLRLSHGVFAVSAELDMDQTSPRTAGLDFSLAPRGDMISYAAPRPQIKEWSPPMSRTSAQ